MDYYDIDVYERQVTTTSTEAQLWFNRGLVWCYSYFHDEAIACFTKALEADPNCAMAHWGIAYAAGPNYNMPWQLRDDNMRRDSLAIAYDATQAAMALIENTSPAERALIEALTQRYPQRDPTEIDIMRSWNDDFAHTMKVVHETYPNDLDVMMIYVEAIMNQTPWLMWNIATGEPAEGADTLAAQSILESAFKDHPEAMQHPGLLHIYVHLMEMSPFPEKALKAGDALRTLVPDAGHLIHMATHIDIQCGHYHNTLHWNQQAIKADRKALERNGLYTFYSGYRLHNYHFAAYGAMFLGQFEPAWAAARELVTVTPEDFLRIDSPPFADYFEAYIAVWVHVLIRFGRWQQIIAEPLPEDSELFANLTATLHYAKGVAHAARGEVTEAEQQQTHFLAARDRMPPSRLLHNVTCHQQLEVAESMLAGEIEYRKANYDVAFQHLRDAIEKEDALPYDEPWGWMQPTRHALGALLFEQGRVDEAETVYREDLGLGGNLNRAQIHPDNVWSLRGLNDCLVAKGLEETAEGRLITQRLALAEARADRVIGASCFCAQSAE